MFERTSTYLSWCRFKLKKRHKLICCLLYGSDHKLPSRTGTHVRTCAVLTRTSSNAATTNAHSSRFTRRVICRTWPRSADVVSVVGGGYFHTTQPCHDRNSILGAESNENDIFTPHRFWLRKISTAIDRQLTLLFKFMLYGHAK